MRKKFIMLCCRKTQLTANKGQQRSSSPSSWQKQGSPVREDPPILKRQQQTISRTHSEGEKAPVSQLLHHGGKGTDGDLRGLESESRIYYFLATWPWTHSSTSEPRRFLTLFQFYRSFNHNKVCEKTREAILTAAAAERKHGPVEEK